MNGEIIKTETLELGNVFDKLKNINEGINPLADKILSYIAQAGNLETVFGFIEHLNNEKDIIDRKIEVLKLRLMALHRENGEQQLKCNGYMSYLHKTPYSLPFLKDLYGVNKEDLPDDMFKEKINKVPDFEKIEKYLHEYKDINIEPRFTVCIKKCAIILDRS